MVMQFLQLSPWKGHTGVLCVPPERAKSSPNAKDHSHFPVSPVAREEVGSKGRSVLSVAQSFLPAGSSRSGASAAVGGNLEQGWEGEVCPMAELSITSQSTALRFASPAASVGKRDAFDPLPSPISLPLKTNFHHPGVWLSKLSSPSLTAAIRGHWQSQLGQAAGR